MVAPSLNISDPWVATNISQTNKTAALEMSHSCIHKMPGSVCGVVAAMLLRIVEANYGKSIVEKRPARSLKDA